MLEFSDLPNEVLINIFSELDYRDLSSILQVNWRCNNLASTESFWENISKKHWNIHEKTRESWKSTFIAHFEEYGRYIKSYCMIESAWNKLKDILQQEAATIVNSLEEGVTEAELDDIESRYKCKLPDSLRLFYRLCGGQSTSAPCPGLFGSLANAFSYSLNSYYFLQPKLWTQVIHGEDEKKDEELSYEALPIAYDHFGNQFSIVLPKVGKELISGRDPPAHSMVWKTTNRLFKAASTFSEWFLDFVRNVLDGSYVIQNGHIFRYLYEPDCVARTGAIEVRAGWVASQLLEGESLLFEYRITMTMDEDANPRESCQLMERHWIITHSESGKVDRVNGRGVVGEYPVMKPGAKFSWMSRTYFTPPGGSMEGHFTMKSLTSASTIEIACPRYNMPFPLEYTKSSAEDVQS